MGKFSLVYIFLIICSNVGCASSSSKGRKNVLVFIGDDAGFETEFYNNSVCQTPNLNELSERSVIFNNAFTSVSSCSPSRSAILTGEVLHFTTTYTNMPS